MCADLAVVSAAWLGAYAIRFHCGLLPLPVGAPEPRAYALVGLAALPLFYTLLRSRGLYSPRRGLSRFEEARSVIEIATIGSVVLAAGTFFSGFLEISRPVVALFWALSSAGLLAFRHGLRSTLSVLRRRGYNVRRVLLVGGGPLATEVERRFANQPETGFRVVGFLAPGRPSGPGHLGNYEQLAEVVARRQIDQVVIAVDRAEPVDPLKLIEELRDSTAAVRIVPDLLGLRTMHPGIEDLEGMPMIRLVESPVLGWREIGKRGFDVTVAASGLVLLSPLFAAIAAGVKLSMPGGPVVYRQQRMSLDGRLFTMLKFRTMVPNAEASTGPKWAVRDDPRTTPLGGFLRRWNLDELPQLWNILRGDMSVVGPRPEREAFIERFRREIPGYMLRHKVKGGLTGWAQINGCRGDTSIEERLERDLEYAQRCSLAFDLKIVFLTILRSFRDPNAY